MADVAITAANVVGGAGTGRFAGTAGETIAAGKTCRVDADDDNKVKLADATDTDKDEVRGIALNGASNNQPITLQVDGDITIGGTLAVGTIYVNSPNNPGGIAPAGDLGAGDFVSVLGVAKTTAVLSLKVNNSAVAVPA